MTSSLIAFFARVSTHELKFGAAYMAYPRDNVCITVHMAYVCMEIKNNIRTLSSFLYSRSYCFMTVYTSLGIHLFLLHPTCKFLFH